MSVFGTILSKIFGCNTADDKPIPAPQPPVDVDAVLRDLASKNKQRLSWRTSIIDLMKLLDIDSSFENRSKLALELGYGDEIKDTADMNIWLHREVMRKLAENGGKVPDDLKS
jgi:hypothetical protein